MAADGPEDQPGEPRGDGHQVPPDAEGPEPGECSAQHDEDVPEVRDASSHRRPVI